MNNNHDEAGEQLQRLADALARNVDHLSDEELIQEATEEYGDPENATLETRNLIQEAIAEYGKRRLAAARTAYEAQRSRSSSKVFELSAERRREIVIQFASNDNQLREKLTMAARKQDDLEADIDSFLEDLIELGVIDDEGNVR